MTFISEMKDEMKDEIKEHGYLLEAKVEIDTPGVLLNNNTSVHIYEKLIITCHLCGLLISLTTQSLLLAGKM